MVLGRSMRLPSALKLPYALFPAARDRLGAPTARLRRLLLRPASIGGAGFEELVDGHPVVH